MDRERPHYSISLPILFIASTFGQQRPILVWRWKILQPVAGADTTKRYGEDAPVRVIVSFAGDVKSLPFSEQLFFSQTKALTGIDVPYATLEYVWGTGAPKGTIVINSYTSRIRMILVESGGAPLDEWVIEVRDVVEDFRRAFGEEPGHITAIAIYTDADATRAQARGVFGDIAFLPRDALVPHPPPTSSAQAGRGP